MDELPKKIIKAAIYARVSTQAQETGKTVDAQLTVCRDFCARSQYEVVGEYRDEGWSGGLAQRPRSDQLILDAEKGLFNVVVCAAIDRISREPQFYYQLVPKIEKFVPIVYVQTPIDGENREILEPVFIGIAAFERKRIRERFSSGKREKVIIRKEFMGHIPSYGLRYILKNKNASEKGHLEINETEAEIVKMVFRWVAFENVTAHDVVRRLTVMKIPTRKNRDRWGKSSVLRILKNENYVGRFFYYRRESVFTSRHRTEEKYRKNPKTGVRLRPVEEWALVELPHLRLITDESFKLAQQNISRNAAFSKRNCKNKYLLGGGLIKCESCGCSFYATSQHGYPSYKCGNRQRRFPLPRDCQAPTIGAKKIETAVWNLVVKILKDPEFLIEQLEKNRDLFEKDRIDLLERIRIIESQISSLDAEEQRIVAGYTKGVLSDAQAREPLATTRDDKSYLAKQLEESRERLTGMEFSDHATRDIKKFCRQVQGSLDNLNFEEKQEIIRLVVKEILFNGKRIWVRGYLPIRKDGDGSQNEEFIPINPSSNGENQKIGNIKLQYYISNLTPKWEFEVRKKL